jgi:cobalt-zinc-cadmium efflux system membrane fusion protein
MKNMLNYNFMALTLVAALALAVGCSKINESAGQGKAEAAAKPATGEKLCEEHGLSEDECGICHPERAAKLKSGEGSKVRLPSVDSATLVGVETAPATVGAIPEAIECYAELSFNQNKVAQIAAPVGGIIQEVSVDLGGKVEEKQPVAKIWSASIAEAVAKAVLSHQTLDRERKLRADRVSSEKDLQQAEAEHRAACQQLRTQGFTEEQIDALVAKPHEQVLMEVRAPFAGEIVERTAVRGALVEAGKSLFTLTDRSVMWAMLNLPETAQAWRAPVPKCPTQTVCSKRICLPAPASWSAAPKGPCWCRLRRFTRWKANPLFSSS